MIFCAKKLNADQAYKTGLVTKISKNANEILNTAIDLGKQICQNAPLSILAAKCVIDNGFNLNIENALKLERKFYDRILSSKDRQEGLNAFKEKRFPKYQGC